MADPWRFLDQPNTASFTTIFVLDGSPILRVYHGYDGEWQFHGSPDDPATPDVARVVSLGSMIARDKTLNELHDLPGGWLAFRSSVKNAWRREKNNPFPSHAENGYYLEDTVWMAQYRDDVHPPTEELRRNLKIGTCVKLVFRFAAEDAERRDNETERMWVRITEIVKGGSYTGTLENDPQHTATLTCGATIHFHPCHIMEVLDQGGL